MERAATYLATSYAVTCLTARGQCLSLVLAEPQERLRSAKCHTVDSYVIRPQAQLPPNRTAALVASFSTSDIDDRLNSTISQQTRAQTETHSISNSRQHVNTRSTLPSIGQDFRAQPTPASLIANSTATLASRRVHSDNHWGIYPELEPCSGRY